MAVSHLLGKHFRSWELAGEGGGEEEGRGGGGREEEEEGERRLVEQGGEGLGKLALLRQGRGPVFSSLKVVRNVVRVCSVVVGFGCPLTFW